MAASTRTLSPASQTAGLGLGVVLLVLFGIASGVGIAMGELEAMLGSLALIACVAALVDYRVGTALLIVLWPVSGVWFFPHSMFGFTGLNPINVLLAATSASLAVRGHLRGFVPRPMLWLYILPIVFAGLLGSRHAESVHPYFYENMLIHFNDTAGYLRDQLMKPLLMLLGALLIAQAAKRSQKPERFLYPIVIAVWAMSLTVIGFVAASDERLGALASTGARGFLSALGMHANDLGRLFAVAYALLLFTWWETRETGLKTLLFATMGVLTIALMLTFSRGAFVGFLLVNALFFLWKFNARTMAIGVLVLALGALLVPGAVLTRMSLGFEGGGDLNTVSAGRIDEIWLPLVPDILRTPPWGNGLDSVMWSEAAWSGTMLLVNHPHSAYIQAYLDTGVIGMTLFFAYFWQVWKSLLALGSNAYLSATLRGFFQGAVAGLLCFLATGFSGSTLRPTGEFVFLWFAIGMMYGVRARTSDRSTTKGTPPPLR